jgi:hypothetical protein
MNIAADTWYELLIVGASCVAILWIVQFAITNILKAGGRVKGKNVEIGAGEKEIPPPPHVNCPHSSDILSVIAKTAEVVEYKHDNRKEAFDAQVQFYKEKAIEIRGMFLRIFVKLLDDSLKDGRDVVLNPEYLSYCAVLDAIESQIRDFVEACFESNHFAEMEGDVWNHYKDRKRAWIVETSTKLLNQYWRGELVRRERLYKENHSAENTRSFCSVIDEIFENARREAVGCRDRFTVAIDTYESYIKEKVTGESGSSDLIL